MKEKVNMRNAFALHMRGLKELHTVSPKFFPLLTVYSIFSAITPYITVFFSAQILKELATLRRAENLWQWVIAGVLCVGIAAIAKAKLCCIAVTIRCLIISMGGKKYYSYTRCFLSIFRNWINRRITTSGRRSSRMKIGQAGD